MSKKPIQETERCKLFESIAEMVWKKIVRAHEVNIDLKEVGITADILVEILQYNKLGIPNFDVYAKPGWSENIYGSDIDVFIETESGLYRWFALQAKILKKNNRYDTLRDSSDGIMQWTKLAKIEAAASCKAYYLLYNGKDNFKYSGTDFCENDFVENQYGCSLVEPKYIEEIANKTSQKGNFITPTFEDIHPKDAQPWRILTCCLHDTTENKLYSSREILESNPSLKIVNQDKKIVDKEDFNADQFKEKDKISVISNNSINEAARKAKWNPPLRIIVKRTDNFIS